MNIKITVAMLEKFNKKHPNEERSERFLYLDGSRLQNFSIDALTEEELDTLVEIAGEDEQLGWNILKQINTLRNIKKDPGGRKCKRLEDLANAMKSYLQDVPNHWLFEDVDGCFVPHYIQSVEYNPPDSRSETPAYVEMELGSMYRGDRRLLASLGVLPRSIVPHQ